ncbi:MAG: acyl-CoA thioesterase [Sphingomonas bacterium]|nr:acyl-CoA thioesterase [Sphingomonas bacterium]
MRPSGGDAAPASTDQKVASAAADPALKAHALATPGPPPAERDSMSFFQRQYRIEWGQCDPAGIVYAPRYLDMFGENTILLFEAAGLPKKRQMLAKLGVAGFPMVDVQARFLRPTAYGDEVVIEADAPAFGNSSFTIAHRLLHDGTLCVECTEKRVWTVPDASRPGGLRAERVPDEIRALFARGATA